MGRRSKGKKRRRGHQGSATHSHNQSQSEKEREVYRTEKGKSLEEKCKRDNLSEGKLARNKPRKGWTFICNSKCLCDYLGAGWPTPKDKE